MRPLLQGNHFAGPFDRVSSCKKLRGNSAQAVSWACRTDACSAMP